MSHYAAFARFRAVRSALGFAGALALVGGSLGCTDNELTRLQAQFNIVWDDDRGFNAEVEHLGVMEDSMIRFGDVTTGQALVTEVQVTNAGSKDLDLCGLDLVTLTFEGEGESASWPASRSRPIQDSSSAAPRAIGRGEAVQFECATRLCSVKRSRGPLPVVSTSSTGTATWSRTARRVRVVCTSIFGTGDGEPVPDIYANPASIEFPRRRSVVRASDAQHHRRQQRARPPEHLERHHRRHHELLHRRNRDHRGIRDGRECRPHRRLPSSGTGQPERHDQRLERRPDEAPLEIPVYGVANPSKVGDPPVAVCGPTIQSAPFERPLDGTASYDPNGLTLTYNWT